MYDYIQIGAWRSDSVPDLHVLEWEAPLMPKAAQQAVNLPGRMSALEDPRRDWRPETVNVTLAIIGEDQAETRAKYRAISRVLTEARILTLSDMPNYHYRGHTTEIRPLEDTEKWLKFRLAFQANPPCLLRVLSQQAGFIPAAEPPIPEQLTDQNATRALDATGTTNIVTGEGIAAWPPEIYLAITGTWQQLNIGLGGLVLPAQNTSKTVYIDAEARVAYRLEDGLRAPVMGVTGRYEPISQGAQLRISGLSFNVHIRLLSIERS